MSKAQQKQVSEKRGFVIPEALAEFPAVPREGTLLTIEQEQSYGYSMILLSLDMVRSMACDLTVIAAMLDDMDAAFTADKKADKAVALINVDGEWLRAGSINSKEFATLALAHMAKVRAALTHLQSLQASERDLFYVKALNELRNALAALVPYDMILSKAYSSFKERCGQLNNACKALVSYVSKNLHAPRMLVQGTCEQFWVSNKLPAICNGINRYAYSIMPVAAKKEFRSTIVAHQSEIGSVALATGVPVTEMLASWSSFNRAFQRMDRMSGTFAMFNTGLAESISRKHSFASDYDAVRSAAYQGLTRAMSLYAPEKGLKFSTYATNWIKQMIIRGLIQQELIRLPEGSHKMLGRIRAVYADLPHASDEYVCSAAGVTQFELDGVRPFITGTGATSLDSAINGDDDEFDMYGLLADENNDFAGELEAENEGEYILGLVREALDERSFYVLTHRTGLGGTAVITAKELAVTLGTSIQNISYIEKRAQGMLCQIPELKEIWELMA